jgi:hypothetical protein
MVKKIHTLGLRQIYKLMIDVIYELDGYMR